MKFFGMVGLARVELATNGLGNRCSIHLSYSPTRGAYHCTQLYSKLYPSQARRNARSSNNFPIRSNE